MTGQHGTARRPRLDICVGGTWHSSDLARGFAEIGFDVRIVSTAPIPDGPYEKVHVPGWTAQRIARRVGYGETSAHRLAGKLLRRAVRRDSQIVAWSSFALPLLRDGRKVVVVRGSHHIQRQRDILLVAYRSSGGGTRLPSEAAVALERAEYHEAIGVSVPTNEIAADPYWAEDLATVHAIPYGFPTQTLRNGDGGDSRSVIFAGEPSIRKGIDRLSAAFPQRGGTAREVTIVGRLPRGTAGVPLPDWWTLMGQVDAATARRAISRASVLVLLSREEGMARVGLEALAAGTPIIVSPMTGLAGWVASGGGKIVEPDDVDAVRRAFCELVGDWRYHSDRAREVAQSWTWAHHARKMASCLPT